MVLTSILRPEAVKVMASTTSKKRLFHEVIDMMAATYDVAMPTGVEALLDRENLGPTGVGKGVALPHARLPEIDTVLGGFVRLEKPMAFEAVDQQPVDLLFFLLAPETAGVEHLKALALVARTLRDERVCEKLRSNKSPAALHGILSQVPTSVAA
ncbi:MAG: PTS sugar transporter subunit IIA [Pseudomonadota bacterium]